MAGRLRRTAASISRRARRRGPPPARGECGGAVSLWVVLMVPVSAFAAVVAMAGPQRLAAESSMQEAAEDIAVFAVVWRDGHQQWQGPLPAFFPECAARSRQQEIDLAAIDGEIALLDPTDPNFATLVGDLDMRLEDIRGSFSMLAPGFPAVDENELRQRLTDLRRWLDDWDAACESFVESLVRDLGYLGVDVGSLRGSYSDSLSESPRAGSCTGPDRTRRACEAAGDTWTPDPAFAVPCLITAATAGRVEMVAHDAVHVAVVARWQDAGWAAAQVWPDGLAMAAESMGRFAQRDPSTPLPPRCGRQLVVLDSEGRPVWAGGAPNPVSRQLAQSVARTALSG